MNVPNHHPVLDLGGMYEIAGEPSVDHRTDLGHLKHKDARTDLDLCLLFAQAKAF